MSSNYITTYLDEGTAADLPAAPAGTPSTGALCLYYATDTKVLYRWNGSSWDEEKWLTAITGDMTTAAGPGSVVGTLATVNSDVGSYTNASITVNAKGLVTAASSGSGGSLEVTDGTHTVSSCTEIDFTSGATVTASGSTAQVAITGGGGTSTQFLPAAGAPACPELSGLTTWAGAGTATATFSQNGSGGAISIVNVNDPHQTPVGVLFSGTLSSGDLWAVAIDYISSENASGDLPGRIIGLSDGTKVEGYFIDINSTNFGFGSSNTAVYYASSTSTSSTAWSPSTVSATSNFPSGGNSSGNGVVKRMWWAIGYNGTDITFYYSPDGVNFVNNGGYTAASTNLSSFSNFFVGYRRANADTGWTSIVNIWCVDLAAQNRTSSLLYPS